MKGPTNAPKVSINRWTDPSDADPFAHDAAVAMTHPREQPDMLVSILELAAKRIAKPEQWTKGAIARADNAPWRMADGSAAITSPRNSNATCWCWSGAVIWAVREALADRECEREEDANPEDDAFLAEVDELRQAACYVLGNAALELGLPASETGSIIITNDHPNTTHEQVIAATKHAIRELTGQASTERPGVASVSPTSATRRKRTA